MLTGRLACCVPFCRRTTRNDEGFREWICSTHWRLVPHKFKLMKRRAEAAYAEAMAACEAIDAEAVECAKAHAGGVAVEIIERYQAAADRRVRKAAQSNRSWARCKRAAIEGAAGI